MSATLLKSRSVLFVILLLAIGFNSYAQRVTATIGVGTGPIAIAVNPVTNRIYVANQTDNSVTMIDATNNSRTTIPVGTGPRAIAVNPMTNKIYVANGGSASVTVINGVDNTTATPVTVGTTPAAIAVNPVTNKIYVANLGSNNVTVINGADNSTAAPVSTGTAPRSIAVNTVTNKIYVTNQSSNNVYVINGVDNSTTTVNVGSNSFAVAVNQITNKIYITNSGSGNVTVIDASNSNGITPLSVGTGPTDVAVNPVTNLAYVSNNGSGTVTVIDGANHTTNVTTSTNPMGIGVNTVNNKIYVANASGNKITVIDGATNTPTQLNAGNNPIAVAVNSVTNRAYVINSASNNVTVVDGATNTTAAIGADAAPVGIGVNTATNKIYVANYTGNDVTVIDGATSAAINVPDANGPISIGVNPVTNKIYVANQNSTVTVLDGATNATSLVNVSAPGIININPVTNKIYVVSDFGVITVLDGSTNTVTGTANGGNEPVGTDINPVTNKIYVANCPCDVTPPPNNTVTVIDGTTNAVTGIVTVAQPRSIAVNSVTNKIYVANSNNNAVTVIDGFTNNTFNLPGGPNPGPIAVNPISNRIYVGNNASGSGVVTVIDGGPNFVVGGIGVGGVPQAIAVNPVTNKIYVANNNNTVAVIDGSSNAVSILNTDSGPLALAINGITNKIYAANNGSSDVTAITEQQVSAIPLTTVVTPFTNNQVSIPSPIIDFTTNSSYAPNAPAVQNVFFQMDTWQGQWLAGTSTGPSSFRGNSPVLRPGTHVLYAYASDGQTADSSQADAQSSPVPGQIAAYFFTFIPTVASPAVVLTSTANPSFFNQSVTFTATVAGSLGSPTNTVSFYDNYPTGTLLSTVPVTSGVATFTTSALSQGTHPITAVYSGDFNYTPAISNAVYQFVTRDPTVTVVTLTTGTNPATSGTSLTFTATVTSQYPGVPSGNVGAVVFRDGNGAIGAGTPAGPGVWTFTTSALAPGVHAIIAVYGGDLTFAGSISAPFNEVIVSNAGGASTTTLTVNGGTGTVTVNFGIMKGVLPSKAVFAVNVTGSSNGDAVVLLDGNHIFGPVLTLAGGTASTQPLQLPVGQHNIQAVYMGNGGTGGSNSAVVIVDRSPRPKPR